ncbi:hypothetical protein [Streptomyces sp. NPDC001537]
MTASMARSAMPAPVHRVAAVFARVPTSGFRSWPNRSATLPRGSLLRSELSTPSTRRRAADSTAEPNLATTLPRVMLLHEWTPAHLARQFTRFVRLEAMPTDVVTTQIGNDPARAELIAGTATAGHMAAGYQPGVDPHGIISRISSMNRSSPPMTLNKPSMYIDPASGRGWPGIGESRPG